MEEWNNGMVDRRVEWWKSGVPILPILHYSNPDKYFLEWTQVLFINFAQKI